MRGSNQLDKAPPALLSIWPLPCAFWSTTLKLGSRARVQLSFSSRAPSKAGGEKFRARRATYGSRHSISSYLNCRSPKVLILSQALESKPVLVWRRRLFLQNAPLLSICSCYDHGASKRDSSSSGCCHSHPQTAAASSIQVDGYNVGAKKRHVI